MNRFNPYGYDPDAFTEYVPWDELEIGTLYKHTFGGVTVYVVYKKELPNNFKSFEVPGVSPPFSRILRWKGPGEGMFYRRYREPLKARQHALAAFGRPNAAVTRRRRRRRTTRRR